MTHGDSGTRLKTCSKCGEEKTLDEFHKAKKGKNGLQSKCKTCRAEERRKHYEANKKHIAETNRKWREANKERHDELRNKWREANPKRTAYKNQQLNAKQRGIEWQLTFEEWRDWWGSDWNQRGCTKGCLVMARYGDTGPYALDNIYKTTCEENSRDRERFKAEEMREV